MTNTDPSILDRAARTVNPSDAGGAAYGIGLAATNDTTNLAKMPAAKVLAELHERTRRAADFHMGSYGPDRTGDHVAQLIELTQSTARAEREVLRRLERGSLIAEPGNPVAFVTGDADSGFGALSDDDLLALVPEWLADPRRATDTPVAGLALIHHLASRLAYKNERAGA